MDKIKLYQDKDWLHQKYINEKLSTIKIGKMCRVYDSTISRTLKKYGIKTRSSDETNKGRKYTKETRRRISESLKGMKHTEEAKKNMGKAHKGRKVSEETKKKISEALKGNKNFLGHKRTEEWKRKISELNKLRIGDKNPRWLGGLSFEPYGIEFNDQLKSQIRTRDGNRCQACKIYEDGKCHDVHHCDYSKQNNKPKNLITLCHPCHSKTNTNREYWENYFKDKIA